jgi:hypothetical protein
VNTLRQTFFNVYIIFLFRINKSILFRPLFFYNNKKHHMLKKKMQLLALEKKSSVGSKFEILSDANAAEILGGLVQHTCGNLTSCGTYGADCPKLQSCGTYS